MADAQDRLWIDLNADGRFDPSAEQFLFATVLNLDGCGISSARTSWGAGWPSKS